MVVMLSGSLQVLAQMNTVFILQGEALDTNVVGEYTHLRTLLVLLLSGTAS
jgi:hypothetical protein